MWELCKCELFTFDDFDFSNLYMYKYIFSNLHGISFMLRGRVMSVLALKILDYNF